jgi:hypothetical protein
VRHASLKVGLHELQLLCFLLGLGTKGHGG